MPNPTPNLATLNDAELIEQLLAAEADKSAADLAAKKLKNELINRKTAEIKAAYVDKPEPFGVVNLPVAGKLVKIDTKKTVEWNQKELDKLWKQIVADGADPTAYMKLEYTVSEAMYKAFGDNLRAYFEPARSVKPGNPTVKIEEAKE